MDINPLTVGMTIINFFIFCAVVTYFLYKPVMKILTERQSDIDEKIRKTEEDKLAAHKFMLENKEKLDSAKDEGKKIVENLKLKAEKQSDDILKEAKSEADLYAERARKEVEREKDKAKEEIKTQAIDLAIMLSTKALEESIDEEKHRKLINDFIAKVGI